MKNKLLACLALTLILTIFLHQSGNVDNTSTKTQITSSKIPKNHYPIRFGYINRIPRWWPAEEVAAGLGVPGFARQTLYNYIAFAYWSYSQGPVDTVSIWANPVSIFGADSQFGSNNWQIQRNFKKRFNDAGIKVMVSAFGTTNYPVSENIDPIDCANKLGNFVANNNLDGVDIAWIDNHGMESGKGQQWLITFTVKLRQLLPNHIITQAPLAPYFKNEYYRNGGYTKVDHEVGSLINFYNVQFFNQGNSQYDTYQTLFIKYDGFWSNTSVKQLIKKGIPREKIVVGKPVTKENAWNTGTVPSEYLGEWIERAYRHLGWYAGLMYWEYMTDNEGHAIWNATHQLIDLCNRDGRCTDPYHLPQQQLLEETE